MLRRRAVPLVEVVLLGNGNGRDDVDEPSEQYGDLAWETDVVHRRHGLSCQTHSSRLERIGVPLWSRGSGESEPPINHLGEVGWPARGI